MGYKVVFIKQNRVSLEKVKEALSGVKSFHAAIELHRKMKNCVFYLLCADFVILH